VKSKNFVSQSLFFCGVLLFLGAFTAQAENLPEIDAREFQSVPIKKSHTGRVYEFKTETAQLPKTGSVILFKDRSANPIMAFRVLQTDPTRNEYVAKRVRRYDQVGELTIGTHYNSTEKLAEVLEKPEVTPEPRSAPQVAAAPVPIAPAAPIPVGSSPVASAPVPIAQNSVPADPLMSEPAPPVAAVDNQLDAPVGAAPGAPMNVEDYDSALDQGTSPVTKADKAETKMEAGDEDADGDDDDSPVAKTERVIIAPFDHTITVLGGYFSNLTNFSGSGGSYTGYGLAYETILNRDLNFTGVAPQDSLGLEFGLQYYEAVGIAQHSDSYTLIPLRTELRYHLAFSSSFSLTGYLGAQFNFIAASANVDTSKDPDASVVSKIQGFQPTIGVGFLYNLGPQWYLRADLGWDRIAAGLCIEW
jgi:hypothetical protein